MLNLNPLVLSKLTSSFSVNSSGLRLNLGLNLKFEAKKLKVLGYSRKGDTGWEYSQKAIDLIAQYMIKFPEFIAGIMRNPKGDIYEDKNFYPEEIAKEKMKEIGAWLKLIESKSFEKVPLEAAQLDSDVVGLIEKAADHALETGQPPEPKKLKGVPRSALLKPSDAEQRVGNQQFSLGDRVVYVQDSGRVPIGQRGTVVGLTRTSRTTLLDIVFDTTFMSGTSLGERCSPFRGSTVPMTSVLNLTDKQVVAWSPAGLAKHPQQTSQPLTVQRGYGAPTGPGGYGGLVPAANPGPLRGSFRGAVAGHMNGNSRGGGRGGRGGLDNKLNDNSNGSHQQQSLPMHPRGGRGGFAPRGQAGFVTRGRGNGRGGFVSVDNTNPLEGVVENNPNFRPKSYNTAPPPPQLDAQRGGRGRGPRGVFRGERGGRARGRGRGGQGEQPQVQPQAE
jgi:5'-3' exoribonuclease 1